MENSWEPKYRHLFARFSQYEDKMDKDYEKLHASYIKSQQTVTKLEQQQSELEDTLRDMGLQVKDAREHEENYVKERSTLLTMKSKMEGQMASFRETFARHKRDAKRTEERLKETVNRLRGSLVDSKHDLMLLRNNEKRLKEERQELEDQITEMNAAVRSSQLKVRCPEDKVLAKFIELFPQDEEHIRLIFLDKHSNSCGLAFRLLLQLCFEDATTNFPMIEELIGNKDDMIATTERYDLYLELCRYAKVVQCKHANLFDETTSANAKAKVRTKYKISYEEIDLVNARQQFVFAILNTMREEQPTRLTDGMVEECSPAKETSTKRQFDCDESVGFT